MKTTTTRPRTSAPDRNGQSACHPGKQTRGICIQLADSDEQSNAFDRRFRHAYTPGGIHESCRRVVTLGDCLNFAR
ncbi:hypothetical protein SBA5_120070 [Candidatus Sulfotelmatomonas gaucii]|uniref:Uncharacterized protein n=1 Tax=Candidatus Sulfuritelmatomonas gaucii TaxID=2043161 RepID=A0A2N9L4K8_9BACT|nr:hypothetical protein SBA5_120070 [Candidatus Sulfotelmatomonas gaucii]